MACCFRSIWLQALALVGVGAAIGLADSMIRPVMIQRPPPPPLATAAGATGTQAPAADPPVKPAPTPPGTTVKPPDGAPAVPPPAGEVLTADLVAKGHITVAQALGLYGEQAYFIDARRQEEYEAGHVAGSFRVTLAAFSGKTPPIVGGLPRDGKVVVYCVGGNCDESEAVAKQMNLMGFVNVYVMHAGFPGWKDAGHPVETGPGVQEEGH